MIWVVLAGLLAHSPGGGTRRYALAVGANDGGPGRVHLRYAGTDARAISTLLTQLGGVAEGDLAVVQDPSAHELLSALSELRERVKRGRVEGGRTEVLFYYSGHSDELGLLLKEDRVSYSTLRAQLDTLDADVRIAFLDSCASGAFALTKGGQARPPFLLDESTRLQGHAFLTSASASEAAQESERLRSSVFTHFLISGLRGGADANRDGRVSLSEAYQFAYGETLARTTASRAGPQRPTYEIQLTGTGDLVLTDLRAATSTLTLDASLSGHVFVFGVAGSMVLEISKPAGRPLPLALEPGSYRVIVDAGPGNTLEARTSLTAAQSVTLARPDFSSVKLEATVLRGDDAPPRELVPFELALLPSLAPARALPRVNVGLGLLGARVGEVEGVFLSTLAGWVEDEQRGFALSGLVLRLGALTGVALAPGAVLVDGEATGVAMGSVTMARGEFVGAQVGLINLGGDVRGAQVGLLNIASTVTGAQVGLVNIAKRSSAPIGLVNVMTQGHTRVAVWAAETSMVNVAVKVGGDHVFSSFNLGWVPLGKVKPHLSYGFGVGAGTSLAPRWTAEVEASVNQVQALSEQADDAVMTTLKLTAGFRVTEMLTVLAGVQVSGLFALTPETALAAMTPWGFSLGDGAVRLVPGVHLGIEVF